MLITAIVFITVVVMMGVREIGKYLSRKYYFVVLEFIWWDLREFDILIYNDWYKYSNAPKFTFFNLYIDWFGKHSGRGYKKILGVTILNFELAFIYDNVNYNRKKDENEMLDFNRHQRKER